MAIGSTTGWPYLSTTSSTKTLLVLPASYSTASTTTSQFNLSTIASTSRSTTYFGHPLPFLSLLSWNRIWAKSSWWGTPCFTEGSARCPFPLFSPTAYIHFQKCLQNRMMRRREFFLWFCTALWHGVVIFFGWVRVSIYSEAKGGRANKKSIFSCSSGARRQAAWAWQATSPTLSSSISSVSGFASTLLQLSSSISNCGSRQDLILKFPLLDHTKIFSPYK